MLDTNVVLDLLVFRDPRTVALRAALDERSVQWLATAAMRDELAHVLAYPGFVARADANEVLAAFDVYAQPAPMPMPSRVPCRDEDDQKFIDLAVAHRALLVSKDKDVLRLRKRLARLAVEAVAIFT